MIETEHLKTRATVFVAVLIGFRRCATKWGALLSKEIGATLLLIAFLTRPAWGDGYQIGGRLIFRNYDEQNNTISSEESTYTIGFQECKWWIHILPKDISFADYHILAHDGSNVYQYSFLLTGINLRKQRGEKVGQNSVVGSVIKGQIPRYLAAHEAGVLWLAFASACYFDKIKNERVEPAALLNVNSGNDLEPYLALEQKASWTRETRYPFFIKQIVYHDDGIYRPPDSTSTHPTIKVPPPYDRGFTNTVYWASGLEDFGGMLVPRQCVLKTFWIKKGGTNPVDLRLMNEYTVDVEVVTRTNLNFAVPPGLPGLAFINDYRFSDQLKPIYRMSYATADHFLTDEEAKATPEFQQALIRARQLYRRPAPTKSATVFVILLLAVTALAIVAAVLLKKKPPTKERKL